MTNKSSKSFTGEDREEPNKYIRTEGVEKKDIKENTAPAAAGKSREGKQENLKNRGFQEEQPDNPVRSSGSLAKEQQKGPAGEPEQNGK
jgi:hypothetical protein